MKISNTLLVPLLLLSFIAASPAAKPKHPPAPKPAAAKPAPVPAPAAKPTVPADWEGEFQPSTAPFKIPAGYSAQVLDPIGARVPKPKDWFYGRTYDPRGYTWILSRENPSAKGGYQTGLRIQLLQGVKKGTGKTLKDFVDDFFTKKKADGGTKVLKADITKTCGAKPPAGLRRACLESEEPVAGQGKQMFHLAHIALWNDDTDSIVIMTFGAPVKEWGKLRDTAAEMTGKLELPDFSKKLKEARARAVNCPAGMTHEAQEKLNTYVHAGGKSAKGLFTVAGLGNAEFVFGPDDPHPIGPGEFASLIKTSPDYEPGSKIILHWPYSASGISSFAKQLGTITTAGVEGADGPLWWYPDGTSVVTDPAKGLVWPSADNITTCFRGDGNIMTGNACHEIVATLDHSQAIFGNTLLIPDNCDDIGRMSFDALMGQRNESFQLFLYYSFINPNKDKASTWLSLAAYGHQALAEYFAAMEIKGRDKTLYRQLLTAAARDGDEKAKKELKAFQ